MKRALRLILSIICTANISHSILAEEIAPPMEPANKAPIKIGAILPLTGDFAYFGAQAKIGIETALSELNSSGNNFKVIYEDDRCLPRDALKSFKKLASVDHVDQIIGPVCTGSILAVAESAKSMKRHFLALLDANRPVAASGEFTYAIGYSSEEEAELIAEHMRLSGYVSPAVIYEEDAWAVGVKDAFKAKFTAIGGNITSEEAQGISGGVSAQDYKPVITRAIKHKPDSLFIVPAYNGGFMIKQIRAMGVTLPIFGPDSCGTNEVIEIAKDAANGLIFANAVVPKDTPALKKLELALTRSLKRKPDSVFYAGLGYDGLNLLASVANSGKLFPEAIATSDLNKSLLGFKTFGADRQSRLSPGLFVIKGEEFEPLR
jgi:branched-chain amino acid transport system substrate-binding protein